MNENNDQKIRTENENLAFKVLDIFGGSVSESYNDAMDKIKSFKTIFALMTQKRAEEIFSMARNFEEDRNEYNELSNRN